MKKSFCAAAILALAMSAGLASLSFGANAHTHMSLTAPGAFSSQGAGLEDKASVTGKIVSDTKVTADGNFYQDATIVEPSNISHPTNGTFITLTNGYADSGQTDYNHNTKEFSSGFSSISGTYGVKASANGVDTSMYGPDNATLDTSVNATLNQKTDVHSDSGVSFSNASQSQAVDLDLSKSLTDDGYPHDAYVSVNTKGDFTVMGGSTAVAEHNSTEAKVDSCTWSEFELNPGINQLTNNTTIVGSGNVDGKAVLGSGTSSYNAAYAFDSAVPTEYAGGISEGSATVVKVNGGQVATSSAHVAMTQQ